jgi:hypothetical protein
MAKSKSSKALPSRTVIANRVEEQRRRVWQAQSICRLTSLAAHAEEGGGADKFSTDTWIAMEGVAELLGSIAGELEGNVVLAQVKLGDEHDQEARR